MKHWFQDKPLRFKMVAAAVLVEMVMLSILVVNSVRVTQDRMAEQAELRMHDVALALKVALVGPLAQQNYAGLQEILDGIRSKEGIDYLVLFDPEQKIVASSGWNEGRALPQLDQHVNVARDRLNTELVIEFGGQMLGSLHYGVSLTVLQRAKAELVRESLFIAAIEIILSILFLSVLGYWLTRSLRDLTEASEEVAAGNFNIVLPVRDQDEVGQLTHAFNQMAANIRERVEALRQSEAELAKAQQIAHIGSWDRDVMTNRLVWSDEMYRLFGLAPGQLEATYQTFLAAIHPEDRDRVSQVIENALRKHEAFGVDYRILGFDGQTRDVFAQGQIELDTAGRPVRTYGTVQDVTEQRLAQRALQESDRYQKALLANLPAAVMIHGPDSTIRYCNGEAMRLFGLSEEQTLAWTARGSRWKFLREDGSPMPPEEYPVTRVLSEKKPLEGYAIGIARENSAEHQWVLLNAYPDLDNDGAVHQVVVSFVDITARRNAEEKLNRMLTELDDLYHNAPCGYHSLDGNGVIVRINQTELNWLGYSREEVLGKMFVELFTPASLSVFQESYPRFKENGFVHDLEYELVRKDGSTFTVLLSSTALYDQQGRFVMSRSTLYDITARKWAEKELGKTQDKLAHIVNASPAATYLVELDPDGDRPPHVSFFGESVSRMVGYRLEDWEQPGFWEAHIHPDDRERVLAAQGGLFLDGRLQHEYRFLHENGGEVWIHDRLGLVRDEQGRPAEIVGTWLDITDRVRGEQDLQRLNRLYSMLSLTNQAIIRIRDETKLCKEVCRIAVENGGLAMAWMAMLDEDSGDVVPLAHWGAEDGYLAYLMQKGVFHHNGPTAKAILENRPSINDDTATNPAMAPWRDEALKRGFHSSAAYPVSRSGKPIGTLAVYAMQPHAFTPEINDLLQELAEDLSFALDAIDQEKWRRQAEEQLRHLNEELELRVEERTLQLHAANKELEAFSYSVSHDLRAPLRSIDGFSQILLKSYAERLDETGRDYLGRVRRASQRMGELIDDLLQLSRVSRGEIRWEKVDLSAIAQAVAEELQKGDPERKVTFKLTEGLMGMGDPRLLRIVLENLLGNAWKFTSKQLNAKIEFGALEQEGAKVLFVRDNGAGFNMDYVHKLFGAFQRLHSVNEFEGTGIGLATVQRIVHRHGGRVWAEGALERGATFYFTCNQEKAQEAA